MFSYSDPIIVAAHQRELRLEAERERLAATAQRPAGRQARLEGWTRRMLVGAGLAQRLGRLVAAAR